MAKEDDVEVRIGATTSGMDAAVKQAISRLGEFGEKVNKVAEIGLKIAAFSLVGNAIKETVDKVYEFATAMGELGNETDDTAQILGVMTERVGELTMIAEMGGESAQSMAMGMEVLATNVSRAAGGSKQQIDAFNRMGISIRDDQGHLKDLNTILGDMADSMSRHANGIEKVALARELMGRAGAKLIPILNEGRAAMDEYSQVAYRTGTVLSQSTVNGMVAVQKAIVEANAAFKGLGIALFNVFQPAILALVKTVADLVERMTRWITKSYDTGGAMRWVALMADVLVSAIMTIVTAFEVLWDIGSAVLRSLGQAMAGIGTEVAQALTGNWQGVLDTAKSTNDALVKTWADGAADIGDILGTYKDNIQAMWDATLNPPAQISVHYGDGQGGAAGGGLPGYAAPTDFAAQQDKISQLKQQLQEVNGQFQQVFGDIMSGFDRAISGLISGTMTWKQAMFTVVDSLWSTLVKFIEDWVVKWLAGEATMLVAHQTANAQKMASDVAAQSMQSENLIMNAIKAIFVGSKQTAAGVTANLAPTMGPLAIPAGAAAGAVVAGLASFDVGSWRIPEDQVAAVHKDEMIVPARGGVADMFRDYLTGGGGDAGGGTTHIHNWNGPVLSKESLTKAVTDMWDRNPTMRPSY